MSGKKEKGKREPPKAPPAIVKVYRPELTEEERAKRMAAIERSAARVLMAMARQEAEQKKQQQAVPPL